MEEDNLFEAFDLEKESQSIKYLNKKTERMEIKNNNDNNTLKKSELEIEDILLKNQINTIKKTIEENKEKLNLEEIKDPKINIKLESSLNIKSIKFEGGTHEIIYPKEIEISEMKEIEVYATKYNFELDPFQKESIKILEKNESVLVSAHTSSGKTVIAEYAIAMSLRDKKRVIYTSPIKALSNQKYRELKNKFNDNIGLMTGDVTINENSSCLIMTTEILRNMLYKGSQILKEIAWVIFDEIHYMRDKERGVVWEESIILLSNNINFVFLSATLPNSREFAMWISKIKNQICHVVYTEFRPVPLEHYIYPSLSNEIINIVDQYGNFKEDNFNRSLNLINYNESNFYNLFNNTNKDFNYFYSNNNDIKQLIDLIIDNELDPCIIFAFSKEQIDMMSRNLLSINLTTNEEKTLIEKIFFNAISKLSSKDEKINQINKIYELIIKGIGIHHGGLLPILREIIELIFQEGLIKILFATETFSMGINMPAKTVIFLDIEKFDGKRKRNLTGGEFIQMSGRAGRRGLDKKGITILILKKKMDINIIRNIFKGKSDPLNSSFELNFNQILNLCRIEGVQCEYILKRSFRQFQSKRAIPLIQNLVVKLFDDYNKFDTNYERDELIKNYIEVKNLIEILIEENRLLLFNKESNLKLILKFFIPGRLLFINNFGFAFFIDFAKKKEEFVAKYNKFDKQYFLIKNEGNYEKNDDEKIEEFNKEMSDKKIAYLLVYLSNYDNFEKRRVLIPGDMNKKNGKGIIIPFQINSLENISQIKISIPKDILKNKTSLLNTEKILLEIYNQNKNNIKIYDPILDLGITDKKYKENYNKITELKNKITSIENILIKKNLLNTKIEERIINKYKEKLKIKEEIKYYLSELNELNKLVLNEQLNNMRRVLHRMNYINDNGIITLKGQVACLITTSEPIILTEMLFNGIFNKYNEEDLCLILSCFVNEGNYFKEEKKKIEENEKLINLYNIVKNNIERVVEIYIECKINVKDKESYIKSFKYDLMLCFLYWFQGEKSFAEISNEAKDVYCGSLVRNIRRLDELLKELCDCAILLTNLDLKKKFENISIKIRRGIPFTSSLYLEEN